MLTLILLEPKNDKLLPPVESHVSINIRAVWSGTILLADQLQVLIFISLKLKVDDSV